MVNYEKIIITLDGSAATGKSSLAKRLSNNLGYIHIDTGSMYRAATLFALRLDPDRILRPEILIKYLSEIKIEFKNINREETIFLNNEDVSQEIRETYVTNEVSNVAKIPELRTYLVNKQKELGKYKGVVMDGRDIGTIVFPDAECKFFLRANVEVRAKRRYLEQLKSGNKQTYKEVLDNIITRDRLDTKRAISPLKKAADAIEIDVSNISLDEVFNKLLNHIKKINNIKINKKSDII
tara:strand:- start:11156 stop:11869 length:714 start_codon:yes stop_codon:yes gene_type:complete